MQQVVDFWVLISTQFWSLILQHWLLSAFVLISVLNMVVTLINGSSQE